MEKENKNNLITWLLILGLTILVFWSFFFKGLVPYPGNYMLSWYEPWKSEHTINQKITLIHKAVADDTFRQLFPFRLLTADILKQFELPLWNPYNGSGMPLLASMHSGFLNPFNALFIVLPAYLAWSFHIIMQFVLLCFFTYLYCKSIGMKLASSLFTMCVFALSGFIITRLIFGEYVYVLSCLPLLLYLTETFAQHPKTRKIFLLAPSILFLFISGQPQMILYVLITVFVYAVYRIRKIIHLLFFFLQLLLGICLAGIQLLPTLELYQNAAINTNSSSFIFDRFLLPVQHLITIIIPNYFGNQGTYNYWGAGDYIETIAAVGSIACFLTIYSLWTKDKQNQSIKIFYAVAICLSIISTLDWVGSRFFFSLPIPILSTGIPSRIFIITTFSIAILAGLGFEKLLSEKSFRSLIYKVSPFLVVMSLIFLSSLFLVYTHALCPDGSSNIACSMVALRNTLVELLIFIIFIGVLSLSFFKNKAVTKNFQLLIILLVIVTGVYNANKFLPFSGKETFLPKNELITYLQQKTVDGRVFGFDEANIKTDFATLFRFYDPNYYDPLYIKRYGELVAYAKNSKVLRSDVEIDQSKKISGDKLFKRDQLLNLLSVRYLIYKQTENTNEKNIIWKNSQWFVQKNNDALPHVFLTEKYEVLADDKKILAKIFSKSFDPHTTAIIEKPLAIKNNLYKTDTDKVKITNYKENNVTIESSTSSDQILILTDNYYPGWKAYVDNKQTDIFRTNYTFRGIVLPPGKHQITFSYQPNSLRFGLYLSAVAGIIYLLILISKSMFDKRP